MLSATAPRGKKVVAFCSQEAAEQGIARDMPLAEAKALSTLECGGTTPLWMLDSARPETTSKIQSGLVRPHSIAPTHFEPHDPCADRAALRQLALDCQRFGPYAALEEAAVPECVLVDVTGCGPIFHGETSLAEEASRALRERGFTARIAIADTIGAAWATAHSEGLASGAASARRERIPGDDETGTGQAHGGLTPRRSPVTIIPSGEHLQALRALPVEMLRLSPETVALLHTLDLRRIGQLLELPRAELPSRFGPEVIERLDQALGHRPELVAFEQPAETFEAAWDLDYPSGDRRVIDKVLEQLLQQVLEKLQPRGGGVQRLLVTLSLAPSPLTPLPRSGGEGNQAEPVCFQVGLLQPSASAAHLLSLMRLQSERLQLAGEVDAVSLRVLQAGPLEYRQSQIFADDARERQREQFPALVERLSNRLGEQSVLRPRLWPDAQPELAWRYEPWLRDQIRNSKSETRNKPEARSKKSKSRNDRSRISDFEFVSDFEFRASSFGSGMRPPCLKTRPVAVRVVSVVPEGPPVRFAWKNADHVIARWWGPERIETGWWRGRDVRRDYYLVETTTGAQFWLFRAREQQTWFVHGTY